MGVQDEKRKEEKSEEKNPRVQDRVGDDGGGGGGVGGGGGAHAYGKHARMPVLASDQYKEVVLPNLSRFDPSEIKLDATLVACGKRRTGKSWIFRNIMYLMKDKIPAGIVISQTDELNKFWRQYIPARYM